MSMMMMVRIHFFSVLSVLDRKFLLSKHARALDYARAARIRLRMRACEDRSRAHVYRPALALSSCKTWVATLPSERGAIRERDEMPKERRKRTREHQQRCQQGE